MIVTKTAKTCLSLLSVLLSIIATPIHSRPQQDDTAKKSNPQSKALLKHDNFNERGSQQSKTQGHKIQFCIDGEPCSHLMQLKLDRLFEVDQNGTDVGNKAENFNVAQYNQWSDPEYYTHYVENTTSISTRIRLDAYVLVGKRKDDLHANVSFIVDLFYERPIFEYANATVDYSNEENIGTNAMNETKEMNEAISNGTLKFSVNITGWPWKKDGDDDDEKSNNNDNKNGLSFGVKLKVKTRNGKNVPNDPKRRRRRVGNANAGNLGNNVRNNVGNVSQEDGDSTNNSGNVGNNVSNSFSMERMDLTDGMFLDSPLICILDYDTFGEVITKTKAAEVDDDEEDGISIDWIFPHFEKNLYYDPIMGESYNDKANGDEDGEEENEGGDEKDGNGGGDKDGYSGRMQLSLHLVSLFLIFVSIIL